MRKYFFSFFAFFLLMFNLCFSKAINEKNWIVCLKKYNGEKFSINFPNAPTLFKKNDFIYFQSKEKDFLYSLVVQKNDGEDLKGLVLKDIKKFGIINIIKEEDKEKFKHYLFEVKDKKFYVELTIFSTEKNHYFLYSSYIKSNDEHNYFTSSFFINEK